MNGVPRSGDRSVTCVLLTFKLVNARPCNGFRSETCVPLIASFVIFIPFSGDKSESLALVDVPWVLLRSKSVRSGNACSGVRRKVVGRNGQPRHDTIVDHRRSASP